MKRILLAALFGILSAYSATAGADDGSPVGTTYSVTHAVADVTLQCFPVFDPGLPGEPDDIITFDGIPEATRVDVQGTVPIVSEAYFVLGPGQAQIQIQSQSPPGTRLFPNGLLGPGGQPLPHACYQLGNTDPLDYNGLNMVANASIVFTNNGVPVQGPFDVTNMFSDPWDGTFSYILPNGTFPLINGVALTIDLNKQPPPECDEDEDCDDGDPCTIDTCVDGMCVHTPSLDPCCDVICDDGDPCTIDMCDNGFCIFEPLICDDGDCCTIDTCEDGVCVYSHVSGLVPTQHAARRAFHKAHAPCLGLGGGGVCGGGGGGPPGGVPQALDPWTTNPDCDGETKWRIGLDPGDPPVPAGFFDPGSEPFIGEIFFHGESLGDPDFADADTIIQRSDDPFDRVDLPSPLEVTVDLELVELNLVSCQPITVIIDAQPTLWDVRVTVSDCMPAAGTLTATKTHCNGGTYTYTLPVQQKATFTKVGEPAEIRVFDTGCIDPPFLFDPLEWPTPTSWVHDGPANFPFALNFGSTFHTGVPESLSSTACGDYDGDDDCDVDDFRIFLQSYGHVAFEPEYLPFTDYDADGDTDKDDFPEWLACRRCFTGDPAALAPWPEPLGDMDDDGDIDGDDVDGLVECMFAGNPPAGLCPRADIDQNGVVNAQDTPGFVLLILVSG